MSEAIDKQKQDSMRITSPFGAESTALEVIRGVDLGGKSAVVTGGASGIGVETARALASAGAQVTIAVRDVEAGARVAKAINEEFGADRVTVGPLELGDLSTVRAFAAAWGDRELHLLINNAGVMACPQGYTKDGFETQIGVNHLGHFLLAHLLLPALRRGAPGRLVSLSSSAHIYSDVHLDDLHYRKRPYKPFESYGQSKTANALFALEFDRRFRNDGLQAFSLMPGVIATPLLRHMTPEIFKEIGAPEMKERDKPESKPSSKTKTPEQGAATSIWAAVGKELEGHGGLYLEDCAQAVGYTPGGPKRGVADYARNPETAKQLWDVSEREVGVA